MATSPRNVRVAIIMLIATATIFALRASSATKSVKQLARSLNEIASIKIAVPTPHVSAQTLIQTLGKIRKAVDAIGNEYDGIYVVPVLKQETNECVLHQARNLFYFMDACTQDNSNNSKALFDTMLNKEQYEEYANSAEQKNIIRRHTLTGIDITDEKNRTKLSNFFPTSSALMGNYIQKWEFYNLKNTEDPNEKFCFDFYKDKITDSVSRDACASIAGTCNPPALYRLLSDLKKSPNGLIGLNLGIYYQNETNARDHGSHAIGLIIYKYNGAVAYFILDSFNRPSIKPDYLPAIEIIQSFVETPAKIVDADMCYKNFVIEKGYGTKDDVLSTLKQDWKPTGMHVEEQPRYKEYFAH